jgi:hypothetical protein
LLLEGPPEPTLANRSSARNHLPAAVKLPFSTQDARAC